MSTMPAIARFCSAIRAGRVSIGTVLAAVLRAARLAARGQ
jgi:hypothetical protein